MTTATKTQSGPANGDAQKAFDDIMASSKQNAESVLKATSEAATKAGEATMKRYEDLLALTKESVDAVMQSGTIAAKGWQDVTKAMMGFAKASVEDGFAHTRAVSGVKSVHELIEMHQGFAKAGLDKALAEGSKISEMSMKVVEDATVPLNGHVGTAMNKLFKPAAI